ncbi:MAG: hypothetical protein KF712_20965 [Akkermansiaceae bacterium]|nr:hypothetical protein [Akkermansiaceae bacterium]
MERIPSPYRHSARKPGVVSKVIITLCSLITIALLIFAGSRDWKSGQSVSAILSDTSDIRSLAENALKAGVAKTKEQQTSAQPKEQTSLISHGVLLQRQHNADALPAGMVTATAY